MNRRDAEKRSFAGNLPSEDAVVEVPVLLELQLLQRLEAAAGAGGMSAGALVRCLLRDFLCYSDSGASVRDFRDDSRTASLC